MDLHSWLQGGSWSQDETACPSTLQRDEQVDSASSIVWTDHSDENYGYFEREDQHPIPVEVTSWEPGSGFISLTEPELPPVRYLERLNAEFESEIKTIEETFPTSDHNALSPLFARDPGDYKAKTLADQETHTAVKFDAGSKHNFITGSLLDKIVARKLAIDINKKKLPLSAHKSSAGTYSSGSTDYIVKGLVGPERHQIDALPDTGAKRNFVSQQLVDKLGLVPEVSIKERFRLPTGTTVESSGTVNVPFTFLGESENYLLDCCILPKCTQDLILCQAFLKATGTLTKFTRRITKSLRKFTSRLRFNLIEDDTCCLQGKFDDIPSIALADTGCDAMLISADFARRHSLPIDKGFEHRRTIEYADGSLDTTTGIVYDSTWQFSSSWDAIPCNFYVLDDLKADIILSSHFIFEHEVFSQFEEDIMDTSLVSGRDFGDIYNIRLVISHYSSALEHLEASSIADMNSPGSFSPEAIKAERVRRDLIRDAINALPPEQQDQARIDERNRQEIWDGYRKRHFQRKGSTGSTPQSLAVPKQRWRGKGSVWRLFGRRAT